MTGVGLTQRRPRKRLIDRWQEQPKTHAQVQNVVRAHQAAVAVETHSEAYTDRYLRVATVAVGVTAVGALAFPLASLLSTPVICYIYFPVAQEAWHGLVQERRLRGTVLDCVMAVGLLVGRWFFITVFSGWLYWAGRKLIFLIHRRTGQAQRAAEQLVSQALPVSRMTLAAPAAEKWRNHESALAMVLPALEHIGKQVALSRES